MKKRARLRRHVAIRRPVRGGGTGVIKYPFSITSISPAFVAAGAPDTVIAVLGGIFPVGATIYLNGVAQTTTPISNAELRFTLTAASAAQPAYLNIQVRQGVDHSNTRLFAVNAPVPTLASIAPTSGFVDAGNTNVVGTGTGIYTTTQGRVDGVTAATVPAPLTSATVTIPAAVVAVAGSHNVELYNPPPGGGTSVARVFSSRYRVAALTAFVPPASPVDVPDQEITVTCSNIYNAGVWAGGGSVVTVDGVATTTTFVDATHLRFVLTAAMSAAAGPKAIRIVNPTTGGGGGPSAPLTFNVGFLAPTITALKIVDDPAVLEWNAGPTVVRVLGTNLYDAGNSIINADGVPQATTYVSETELRFTYTPSAPARDVAITVTNNSLGGFGGTSPPVNLAITPSVASITPPGGIQYDPPTVVRTIEGGGPYTGTTIIAINGLDCPTTLVDADTVTITVPGVVSTYPNTLLVQVRRAAGAPLSPGGVTYDVVPYDPLVTATGNYASYDADHVTLDTTPGFAGDILQLNDIVGGVGPYLNAPSVGQNPVFIPSDPTLNAYASIDYNGTFDFSGSNPGTAPLLNSLIPPSDFTAAFVFLVRKTTTDFALATNIYQNMQVWGSDQSPGVRAGLSVRSNGGTGLPGTTGKVAFWMYDSSGTFKIVETTFVIGAWAYVIVKKVGTTLSINVNGGAFVDTLGVTNLLNATGTRTKVGWGSTFSVKLDGKVRALIFGHWGANDFARFYNYCIFRLGIT